MLILAVPAGTIAVLFLLAPGILWAWLCWPGESLIERLTVGLALGAAFQMQIAALLAAGPGITAVSVAVATCGGLLLAAALAWRMRRPLPRAGGMGWKGALAVIGCLALIAGFQMAPLVVHQVPEGWDPSFHSLLASTTVATGHLPTWAPFEPIPLNYPYGPHVIVAAVSLLTGLAPDQAFAVLMNAVLPVLSGLAVYSFARRVLPTAGAALAALAAYGLLGNWGSLDNPRWGGLPNALGLFVLLAFLTVLFGAGSDRLRVVVGGLLLGAIPLAHHHVMLTTVLLLCVYGAYLIVRALLGGDAAARRERLRMLRRLLLMAAIAVITVAYFVVPFALRARTLQDSSVLRYPDHDPGIIFADNGWIIWALALAGAGMLLVNRLRRAATRPPAPMPTPTASPTVSRPPAFDFAALACVVLFAAFFGGYYVYRKYSLHVYHQPYTAFTPTRFLTDMTYFMAPFAGFALDGLWRWTARLPERFKRIGLAGPWSTRLLRGGVVVALCVTAGVTMLAQFAPGEGALLPGEAQAFAWVRAHTPQNALVINLDQNNRWAPYFTQREVAFTPVPISEFTVGYVAEKQYLVRQALAMFQDGDTLHAVSAASASPTLDTLEGRPVVVIADQSSQTVTGAFGAPVYTAGDERVYLVPYFFASLNPAQGDAVLWWSGSGDPGAGWQQPNAPQSGWSATPPRGGTAYVRLILPYVPPQATVVCQAEGTVVLYVDGQQVPGGCGSGAAMHLPRLALPGGHVLAARAQLGAALGPWFDLFVLS